jgi:hypothetical protein
MNNNLFNTSCYVIDAVREITPPFSPDAVTEGISSLLKVYRVTSVTGDRYGGEFPRELFRKHGIAYQCAEKTKSDLYRDLLPLLNAGRITLPRSDRLASQLVGLERRTARGTGRDSIDHGVGLHDDIANAVAGAAALAINKNTYRYDLDTDTDVPANVVPPLPKRLHPFLTEEQAVLCSQEGAAHETARAYRSPIAASEERRSRAAGERTRSVFTRHRRASRRRGD